MKLQDCEKEIIERDYLIGKELEHHTGSHKIRIISLAPQEVAQTNLYYVRCQYYKQNEEGLYGTVLLSNKLNDLLIQYIPY